VVVALLAYSAARFTWMLMPAPALPSDPPPSTVAPAGPARADALSLGRDIVSRHLFGQAPSLNAASAAAIPETSLSLVLRGVVASPDPKTAAAIVADSAGKEDFYIVGQEMPGGAVLKEVHPEHIVLSRGGRFETLRLPKDALQVSEDATGTDSNLDSGTDGRRILTVAPEAGVLLQKYRDQFLQNPQSLANLLQGQPYRDPDNGRLIGYLLRPGRDPGVLAQFGIQSGDVVTAINGVSLVDPAGRLQLLRKLTSASQFNVDLLRNGQAYSVTIPMGDRG
jgi:general secretion pathway protein C